VSVSKRATRLGGLQLSAGEKAEWDGRVEVEVSLWARML